MNAILRQLPPEDLPGYRQKSLRMFYGAGEIWYEHLDGMYHYSDLVLSKYKEDLTALMKPGFPSAVLILLSGTKVTPEMVPEILGGLTALPKGAVSKVAIVGLDNIGRRHFQAVLKADPLPVFPFQIILHRDEERAKKWLVAVPVEKKSRRRAR